LGKWLIYKGCEMPRISQPCRLYKSAEVAAMREFIGADLKAAYYRYSILEAQQ
jgi:hypothetical protein